MSGDIDFKDAAAVEAFIADMEQLLRSRGWTHFEKSLEKSENFIVENLPRLAAVNDVYKALGELQQIRKQKVFPRTMLNTAIAARERLKQTKEPHDVHPLPYDPRSFANRPQR